MRAPEQFSAWNRGDDYEAMAREIPSLEDLRRSDRDSLSTEERERVISQFTVTSLPETERPESS